MSEWHVCFCESQADRWWKRLLKPGFSHVFAYQVIAEDLALVVDRTESELHIYHSDAKMPEDCTIVTASDRVMPSGLPLSMGTCVSLTKHILGIRNPWIITPWQLFKYLEAANGSQQTQEAGEDGRGSRGTGAAARCPGS